MSKCQLPPEGWTCTREAGHSGPCAAITTAPRTFTPAKTYAPTGSVGDYVMVEHSDGKYVRLSDYEELRTRAETAEHAGDVLIAMVYQVVPMVDGTMGATDRVALLGATIDELSQRCGFPIVHDRLQVLVTIGNLVEKLRNERDEARAACAVKDEALRFYSDAKNFEVTVWADSTRDGECWTEEASEHGLVEKPNADFGIRALEVLATNPGAALMQELAEAKAMRNAFEMDFNDIKARFCAHHATPGGVAKGCPECARDQLGNELAALREERVWRPIESAPKDGTRVDLWVNGRREPGARFGKPDHECGEAGPYCDSDWHSQKLGWIDDVFGDPIENPTHWMPLPAAPGDAV